MVYRKPKDNLEARLRSELVSMCKDTCHILPVENGVHPGTPDINGCYMGVDFWLELKVLKSVPGKFRIPHLTERQKKFMVDRDRNGGCALLLIRVVDTGYFLFPWTASVRLHLYTLPQARRYSVWSGITLEGLLHAIQNYAKKRTARSIK